VFGGDGDVLDAPGAPDAEAADEAPTSSFSTKERGAVGEGVLADVFAGRTDADVPATVVRSVAADEAGVADAAVAVPFRMMTAVFRRCRRIGRFPRSSVSGVISAAHDRSSAGRRSDSHHRRAAARQRRLHADRIEPGVSDAVPRVRRPRARPARRKAIRPLRRRTPARSPAGRLSPAWRPPARASPATPAKTAPRPFRRPRRPRAATAPAYQAPGGIPANSVPAAAGSPTTGRPNNRTS